MSTRETLSARLDGEYAEVRAKVRDWLSQPGNEPVDDLPMGDHRQKVFDWARELSSQGDTAMGYPVEYGGQHDVGAGVTAFETLALGDLSLLVKCGVQFGLFGGAILHLGTERHHERYLRDVAALDLPGCFAMTETGHGSNVQALRTTATYDPETEEFVVHTPDDDARKDYIGNAARDGRLAVVFAQLIAGGEERGVHAVLVPHPRRRTTTSSTASGSRTAARSSGSTASTTAASGSTTCACRARTCSTATPRSRPTAPTRARSRTRPSASSRCSGRSSRAASASPARRSARPRWR